jgi:hypothetical protein
MLWTAGRALARPFGSWALKQIAKKGVTSPGAGLIRSGLGRTRTMGSGETYLNTLTRGKNQFNPNWLGKQFIKDPLYKTVAGGTSMFGKGVQWAGKKGLAAGKYAFGTPSGLLFFGAPVTISAGKYLLSDGTELNEDQINQITQGPGEKWSPGVGGEQYDPSTAPSAMAAAAKKARTAKLEKYLDTMGYDKAKKTALGNALIDASAIVQAGTEESGSLKHANWGKMINQAIQTTSKRLDKPEQIREAVGLMMIKADIQKDLSKETDALAKTKLNLQIKEIESKLNPSAGDIMLAMGDKADKQGMLENIVRSNEGVENLKASFKDVKDTEYGDWKKKTENKNKSSLDFMEKIIKPSGAMVPGFYVFPERIVEVKDDLTIKWAY